MLALIAAVALSACTQMTDLKTDISERMFGPEVSDPPAELTDIKSTASAKILWHVKVGASENYDFVPAMVGSAIYAASASGDIVRLEAASGAQAWRVNTGEKLSGGVGAGPNLVLVGTSKGMVLAYDQNGKPLWKSKVSSEVLSAPKVSGEIVVARAGDSRIFGLNAADGKRKWVYERATPTLSLRSSAGVVIDGGMVYAGFAGGKLIEVRLEDGKVIWEASVAQPKGSTEIERIADITSLPVVDGNLVYAAAYQGKIAGIDRATGHIVWSRDISSYTGMSSEDARVFVSHAGGAVYALEYSSGKTFWRQGELRNRHLSAPLPLGSLVAVGDIEGYIHLLTREDGAFAARIRTEESPIMPQMLQLKSDSLLAQTRGGGLYAVTVK